MGPRLSVSSGLENNLPVAWVTERSCLTANEFWGRSCAADERRQRGGPWAGCPSDHTGQAAHRLQSGLSKAGQ